VPGQYEDNGPAIPQMQDTPVVAGCDQAAFCHNKRAARDTPTWLFSTLFHRRTVNLQDIDIHTGNRLA